MTGLRFGGGGNDHDHNPDAPLIPAERRRRTLGQVLLDGVLAAVERILGARE